MLNKLWLFICIVSTASCQFQADKKYADDLKGCLTDKDVKILNKATYLFEQKLKEHYENSDNNTNFYKYLNDLGSIQTLSSFKKDFYLNDESIQIINELENKGTFNKIWIEFIDDDESDEIPIAVLPEYEDPKKEKIEIYSLNPNGDYLNCINKTNKNEAIKEILNSQSNYGNIAPSIIARAMKQKINKNDFNVGLNKVIVAVGFYYDTVNLLNKNPR